MTRNPHEAMTGESGQGENLSAAAANAAKWSTLTQVAMKLIGPITTMALARLLTPRSFGIVASASMVVSLADLVSDAGFQSYLIQHHFDSREEQSLSANVAFWTNLFISVLICVFICVFKDELALLVGCAGYGGVLAISSLSLPITSLVSVQTALFRKSFDFKALFGASMGYSCVNLLTSVGCAFAGFDYWSMVFGTLAATTFRAILLTVHSPWRPAFAYQVDHLRRMLSYGAWILADSAATWINTWAGTFILGNKMTQHDVGLYKTSTSMSASIVNVITGAILPVAFSTLSTVQDDSERFERVFLKMQGYIALCMIPIGAGCFVFRRSLTLVLLGEQWMGTSLFLGLWMLASCIVVVFGFICSTAFQAKGRPQLGTIVQTLYLVPFIPAMLFSASKGYETLSVVLPAARLFHPIINLIALNYAIGISPWKMIKNSRWYYLDAFLALLPGVIVTSVGLPILFEVLAALLSVVLYIALLLCIRSTRHEMMDLLQKLGILNKHGQRVTGI